MQQRHADPMNQDPRAAVLTWDGCSKALAPCSLCFERRTDLCLREFCRDRPTAAHIVVLEECDAVREDLRRLLTADGYSVTVLPRWCREAVGALRGSPDLVIAEMPPGSRAGHLLVSELRRQLGAMDLPVVALAGDGSLQAIRCSMASGADDCVAKPILAAELLRVVKVRLARRPKAEGHSSGIEKFITQALPSELRGPLNGVLGFAELLREDATRTESSGPLSVEAVLSHADYIVKSSQRLRDAVERSLLWIELNTCEAEVLAQRSSWSDGWCLAEVAQTIRLRAVHHGREGDLDLEIAPATLAIPGRYLTRVVSQIVDNAFKFSCSGQRVSISGRALENSYELSVVDRGRGFSEKIAVQLFADSGSVKDCEDCIGLGLGLAIVRRFATLVDGQVIVSSSPAGGDTRVALRLPLAAPKSNV